jgi:Ca2+-binding EF-hand superfamily protein
MQKTKEDLRRRVREAYQLKTQLSKEVVDVGQLITDTEIKIDHIHGQLNDDTGAVVVWVESCEAEFVSEAERLDFMTADALRKARFAAGDRTQFWGLRRAEALLAPQVRAISHGLQRIADELPSASVDNSRALRQLATTLEARLASAESELDGLRKSVATKRLALEEELRCARESVAKLGHSRTQLSRDLEMKTASWNVDFSCSNLNRCQFEDKDRTSAPTSPQKPWKPREPPPKPLEESTLNQLRLKVKSAAYTSHAGMELDMIFRRFDKDGSGQLDIDEVRQALRRSLKVPPSLISDLQIKSLCKQLDADQSGAVSVEEIVDFLAGGPKQTPRKRHAQVHVLAPLTSVSKPIMVTTREGPPRPLESWQSPPPKTSRRPMSTEELGQVRQKIKAAAYAGHLGRQLEEIFSQFDTDGSGQLEDDEVKRALRRTLRLPKSEVSDEQVAALCAALDADKSGAVSIQDTPHMRSSSLTQCSRL